MKKAKDYLSELGYKGAALKNEALLKMATYCLDNNIEPSEVNTKGNSFAQFPADTPIVTDGKFDVTSDTRFVEWYNPKGEIQPLFFNDGTLDSEYEGSCAMSADVYARELPEEGSTLSVRTYKSKTGEIRASVN